jgi:alpha-L-rhamnosidase
MDAGIICPWTIWRVYGDRRILEEHWPNMNRFMDFRQKRDPRFQGCAQEDCGFGDWLSLGKVKTPIEYIDLAYHAYDARLVAEMATALGKADAAKRYAMRADLLRGNFQRLYLQADATLKVHNQSAYAIALFFDLIPPTQRRAAGDHLAQLIHDHGDLMSTGFLGTRPLLAALASTGHHQLAATLAQNKEYPSWGYEVENGATTVWERWNSYIKGQGVHEPAMNSFSHYAFGSAVCEWMFAEIGGIDLLTPGYDQILIAPRPAGTLTRAKVATVTRHGTVRCSWSLAEGAFCCEFTIPPNTTAEVRMPVQGTLTDANGRKVEGPSLGSGTYQFR